MELHEVIEIDLWMESLRAAMNGIIESRIWEDP